VDREGIREFSENTKGILRVMGQRRLAVNAQALCDHLDLLVGSKVAEVIMANTAFALGASDAERAVKEMPDATILEVIEHLLQEQRQSGAGNCTLSFVSEKSADLEIANPVLKPAKGSARMMLVSHWCGVLSELLKEKMVPDKIRYDEEIDVLSCKIIPSIVGKKIA
jgi:tRNA nucleotidyltransferase/poly(A) polymerase